MYVCINLLFHGNDKDHIEVVLHVSYNTYIYIIESNTF